MKFLNKYNEILYRDGLEFWFKVVIIGFMNFMTFVVSGLVYFIPIDLTWQVIGKFPAILLGAFCLYVYSLIFATFLIVSVERNLK